MLYRDYIRLYLAHYMLITETFFRLMNRQPFEKEWYQGAYMNFEEFISHSAQAKKYGMQILKVSVDILNFEDPLVPFALGNKAFLMKDFKTAIVKISEGADAESTEIA